MSSWHHVLTQLCIFSGTARTCWWRRCLWLKRTSRLCFHASCPCMCCHFCRPGTFAPLPKSAGTGGSLQSRWEARCLRFPAVCTYYIQTSCVPSISLLPGLSLGWPLHLKRLVPSIHSSRERVRSVEEPLCLLCLHAGLAHPQGGRRAVRDPQSTKHRDDRRGWGGGGEEEGEEDTTDDQRQTKKGEGWVKKHSKRHTIWKSCTVIEVIKDAGLLFCSSPVAEHSMRTRKPWGSYTKPQGGGRDQTRRPNSGITSVSLPALSWPQRTLRSPSVCLSLDREQPLAATQSLQRVQTSNPHRWWSADFIMQPNVGACLSHVRHICLHWDWSCDESVN